MAPGTNLLVTVDQHSIDLVVEARGPAGQPPIAVDGGNDRWGPEVLLLDTAGEYRIDVHPQEKSAWPGRYTIGTETLPAAGDARRDALALMSRAGREALPDTPDSRRQAEATYREALAVWRALGDRPWEAESLTSLAILEVESSEFRQATTGFQAALPIWRELGKPQREAEALHWLGVIYKDTEGAGKAREAWHAALTLWRDLGERFNEAQTLSGLCGLERASGSLTKALACYQENLALFQAAGVAAQEAEAFNNIGGVYDLQGEPDAALASYQQALALWRSLGDRDKEAKALNNMAVVHRLLGNWQEALRLYADVQEILAPRGDHDMEATLLNNLGFLYNSAGEPQRALEELDAALKLRREMGNRAKEITTLNGLGTSWRKLGDLDKALDQHRQALALAKSLGDLPQQATSLVRLADVHLERGDPAAALQDLDAAFLALGEKKNRTETEARRLQGRALAQAGLAKEALPVLEKALARSREMRDRAGEAETLVSLALAERALGLSAESLSHAREAVDGVEVLRTGFLNADLRASFLSARRRAFSLLIDLLMDRNAADPGKGHDREAFAISERARARGLLDVLRSGSAGRIANAAPSGLLERRGSLLRRLSAKVDRRWRESGTMAEALEKEIDGILAEIDRVEAEIRRNDPRFAAFSAPRPVGPEEISGWLEPGTVLLEYSLGEERSFLWAIEAGRVRSFVLPSQTVIESQARRAYEELSTAGAGDSHRAAAAALGQTLLGPIWSDPGEKLPLRRLVVVPEGALAIIPFAALPVPDPGKTWKAGPLLPLLERLEVVSIPSATTLAVQRQRLRDRAQAPRWAAVFADPVFTADDPRLSLHAAGTSKPEKARGAKALRGRTGGPVVFARLPATRREADAVAGLAPHGKVTLDLGLDASRTAAIAPNLRDYRIVHFATHAVADLQSPELSGLVLSQVDAAGRPREGFLSLSDIYDLDLDADLVVLSGCRTALGKEVRGEGVMGLTRGFQYAGVPRVVASLWSVQDRATAELMARFYKAMWRDHRSPAAALREAQRSLRRDPRYRDPYSWAGFVLQGDWN